MKKNQNKKERTPTPGSFNHPKGISYAGRPQPGADDKEKSISRSHSKDDGLLDVVMISYKSALRAKGLDAAMVAFWSAVNDMTFTAAERDVISRAFTGDIQAVQTLVRKNASVLELPFIAQAMIKLIHEYRYSHKKRLLKDIQKEWLNFLPLDERRKDQMPFNGKDIQRVSDDEVQHNKKDPAAGVAAAFEISKQQTRKIAPTEKGSGRSKKPV